MIEDVIINGEKYVPESLKKVTVRGVDYENVAHWLYNVECMLVNRYFNGILAKQITGQPYEDEEKDCQSIEEFRNFCEKYLGFKWDNENHYFVEMEK